MGFSLMYLHAKERWFPGYENAALKGPRTMIEGRTAL
jgi:hypothetical protein